MELWRHTLLRRRENVSKIERSNLLRLSCRYSDSLYSYGIGLNSELDQNNDSKINTHCFLAWQWALRRQCEEQTDKILAVVFLGKVLNGISLQGDRTGGWHLLSNLLYASKESRSWASQILVI